MMALLAFGASMAGNVPQLFVCAKSPEVPMVLIVRDAPPVFVSVTIFAVLVVVSICPLNVRLVGASPTPGTATPVPVSETVCGLPLALSVTESVPFRTPRAVGVNVTLIVQVFDPAVIDRVAGLIGQAPAPVLVSAKSPEGPMELIVSGAFPVFVRVTFIAALVVLRG